MKARTVTVLLPETRKNPKKKKRKKKVEKAKHASAETQRVSKHHLYFNCFE